MIPDDLISVHRDSRKVRCLRHEHFNSFSIFSTSRSSGFPCNASHRHLNPHTFCIPSYPRLRCRTKCFYSVPYPEGSISCGLKLSNTFSPPEARFPDSPMILRNIRVDFQNATTNIPEYLNGASPCKLRHFLAHGLQASCPLFAIMENRSVFRVRSWNACRAKSFLEKVSNLSFRFREQWRTFVDSSRPFDNKRRNCSES